MNSFRTAHYILKQRWEQYKMEQFSQKLLLYKIYPMNSFIGKHILKEIDYWKNFQQDCDLKHSAIYFTSMISLQHKSMQSPYINSVAHV